MKLFGDDCLPLKLRGVKVGDQIVVRLKGVAIKVVYRGYNPNDQLPVKFKFKRKNYGTKLERVM